MFSFTPPCFGDSKVKSVVCAAEATIIIVPDPAGHVSLGKNS